MWIAEDLSFPTIPSPTQLSQDKGAWPRKEGRNRLYLKNGKSEKYEPHTIVFSVVELWGKAVGSDSVRPSLGELWPKTHLGGPKWAKIGLHMLPGSYLWLGMC